MRTIHAALFSFATILLAAACLTEDALEDEVEISPATAALESAPLCPDIVETLVYPRGCVVTATGQLGTMSCSSTVTIDRAMSFAQVGGPTCVTVSTSSSPEVCGSCRAGVGF